ncbi:MAG: hypothetical protein P0S95_04425 [Rhabdochlamydiaceae bacterium]|nr:hypothetical protein [Candidatus Amphrikana amoebophyrae]
MASRAVCAAGSSEVAAAKDSTSKSGKDNSGKVYTVPLAKFRE